MSKTSVVLGAGPMGRAIARLLASRGQSVRIVTRDGRSLSQDVPGQRADLSDKAETIAACRGAAAIYFCAAPPYQRWTTHFKPLQAAAIDAAAASGAVLVAVENLYGYGEAGVLRADAPLRPTTRKGGVRAEMSRELLRAHEQGRAACVAGRATDFFGPEVRMSALGERFWPPLISGKPIDWIGDPDAPHSFAYLPDLAEAYVALAEAPEAWGKAWHMPALPPLTVRALCQAARGPDAAPTRIRVTPNWLLRVVGLFQPAAGELVEMRYVFESRFEIDHSDFDEHFTPRPRSWSDAIKETVEWWSKPPSTGR